MRSMSVPHRLFQAAALLAAASLVVLAPASRAQETPATKAAPAPAVRPKPAIPPGGDRTLATVDDDKIRYSEVAGIMNRQSFEPGDEERVYDDIIDHLITARLLAKFLNQQKINVADAEIQPQIDQQKKAYEAQGQKLDAVLAANNMTEQELRQRLKDAERWKRYVVQRATEAELRRYFDKNKEVFGQAPIHASHILILVEDDASEADKMKAREKLLAIKKEIDEGKIGFADAANKYSEDPGNVRTPSGGDLGWFTRKGKIDDEFAKLAFAQKVGKVSELIETRHGYHLVLVSDRREGNPVSFDQIKENILAEYNFDLQLDIGKELRSKAKIKIEPMPAEFRLPEPKKTESDTPKPKAAESKK
jgi:parvulin-like peptidyl-prolyl isomerase